MQDKDPVSLLDRSMLAHLEAQQCADDVDVRILHFKGPFGVSDFPTRSGTHTDADVLVEHGGVPILVEALMERGWNLYNENEEGLAGHGQVMIHPQRTCTIDLHHYYPALRSNWEASFNKLYEEKIIWPVDSRPPLTVLNRIDHAIVLLLDTLADRIGAEVIRSNRNQAVWNALTDDEKAQLRLRARSLNVLEIVDPSHRNGPIKTDRDRRRQLMEMQHEPGVQGAAVWLQRLEDSETVGRKLRVLWLALTTVPKSDSKGIYPIRLARHWGRGVVQWLKIFRRNRVRAPYQGADTASQTTAESDTTLAEGPDAQVEAVEADSSEKTIDQSGGTAAPTQTDTPGLISESVLWFIDGEASGAAIELNSGSTLSLLGPAAMLWLAFADAKHADEAIDATLQHYSDPPPEARCQLEAIVDELRTVGLI